MALSTEVTHGKDAALYMLRPNGFKGFGINDATWGTVFTGLASSYFEVVIDGIGTGAGGVDEFKWRQDGGAWTEHVDITKAAQALADGQTIAFLDDGLVTPHTLGDQWVIGHLVSEATTEATITAQITDATKRVLDPNHPPTFTDSGGKKVTQIDYGQGKAVFTANVGTVTVTGRYIPLIALQKVGYLIDWSFNVALDISAAPRCGQKWKEKVAGQADASGSANAYFIGCEAFFQTFKQFGSQGLYFLQLFTYDPDQDQTGDHFRAWAALSGVNLTAPVGDIVKEPLTFQCNGIPSLVAAT